MRGAALGPAQIDSLVWYAEALEADLRVKDIEWGAATDSLRIEIRFQVEQVEFWKSQARKWYDDPRLWFIVGGLSVLWAADISVD